MSLSILLWWFLSSREGPSALPSKRAQDEVEHVVREGERTNRDAGAFARALRPPLRLRQSARRSGRPGRVRRIEASRRDEKVRGRAGRVDEACGRS
ncbi:hypothetical protein AAT19DRAFT_10438 [Rhodotorula toruloides]|uniref:Secreted protein n=1 Tax=Rhodotorula toruloides TaxID=5286 RepID=A0A2S9ZYQ4_RHOTO|nr:hypothetical protein AAT19DRAFT_10438 [Rhodotorula toruloides]